MDKFVEILGCEMAFVCPAKWGDFIATANEEVRLCALCNKTVTLCANQNTLEKLSAEGACVAYEVKRDQRVVRTIGIPSRSDSLRKYLDEL